MNSPRKCTGRQRGFTLIELLVVISLIMLLLGIAAPSLARYFVLAKIKMTEATMANLHSACYVYEGDFGAFPTSTDFRAPWDPNVGDPNHIVPSPDANHVTGGQYLCFLLTGYTDSSPPKGAPSAVPWGPGGDGQDGPGYRLVYRGKVYGPYGSADNLLKKAPASAVGGENRAWPYFFDEFNNPICYYRYDPTVPAQTLLGYRTSDNPRGPADTQYFIDYERNPAQSAPLFYRRDFMLLSPGPDMAYSTGENGQFHRSTGPDGSGNTDWFFKLRDTDDINNLLVDGKGRDAADRDWDRALSNQ